jgi:hypothetical protein
MSPTDVLTEIRDAINDSSSVRWSDAMLRAFMFSGELDIVGRHPEAQYITRVANSAPSLLTSNSSAFTLADDFRSALIHYVAYRALQGDSDDANNAALASIHYKQYLAAMGDQS